MRKISTDKAQGLIKDGVKIDVNGRIYEPVQPVRSKAEKKDNSLATSLLAVAEASRGGMAEIAKASAMIARALEEMQKTKPKKKWIAAVVSRDTEGRLQSLSIEEK